VNSVTDVTGTNLQLASFCVRFEHYSILKHFETCVLISKVKVI